MVNAQQQNPQNQPVVNSGNTQQPNINVQQTLSVQNANIGTFLDLCETRNASDLHFTVGYPPLLRVDGKLERVGSEPITQEKSEELFVSIIDKKQLKRYHEDKELDFSYQHTSGSRFRVNLYFERGNMAGAFRLIPARIRTITELGLPDVIESFTKLPHGLVLVTGPTGSGKSTTLAAVLNEINLTYPKHIITIEDPIEYLYGKGQALVDQREIGKDSMSWKNALKYLLRQDPDVVLVGEMRDFETISSTITVAETGHLVFATLHTNSAAQTIDRIIDVFPEHQQDQVRAQLAVVLQAVVSQRLVPLIGGGRKAVHEILIGTAAVRNAIREGKTYQIDNIIQTSADAGMFLIEKPLAELVRNGEITSEAALEYTNKPSELKNLIGSN
ncbi:PilT/PilU family type 4a pilus ATPase [Candidatus Dojkabacteria bacterium]|nr:PilT/PilU family type 4a pilus ATPase [Candidatus Dojkabacteria bacterium]